MQKHSRALRIAGLLAVGFVFGRWSVELTEDEFRGPTSPNVSIAVAGDRPIAVPTEAIAVDVVPTGTPQDERTVDQPSEEASSETSASERNGLVAPVEIEAAETSASRVVGTWYAETSSGTRLCVLNADGTGTVDAKLSWLASLFYGERLFLNVDWLVDDEAETMIHTVTSGTPADKVTALTNDYGTVKEYRIDSIAEDTLVLVDPGDGEVITWHRRESGATLE